MKKVLNFRTKFFAIKKVIFALFLIAVCTVFSLAETNEKCFRGTVKDASGAVVAGASVQLKDARGKVIERTETDAAGEFALGCFERGEYVLTVSSDKMSPVEKRLDFTQKDLQVSDIVLETSGISETVTVRIEPQFVASVSETATKTATPLRDVPQSIEIVNRSLLDSQAAFSLKDALNNVTAVSFAQGEGRRDQFFIRGFSAIGDQFVDGVRDDAPYYRDLSNVEQVEVVKGPAAVLFGRGSSGGIINRTTKKPNVYERIGSAEINFGSYGLKRGMLDFGQPIVRDKLAFRLVAAREKTGSFRHYFFQDRYNIAPSIDWKPTAKTDITFQFEYLSDERLPDRGIPSFRGRAIDVPIGTYYGSPELDRYDSKVNSQAVRLEHQINNLWTIKNVFRRTGYDTVYYNTFANGICLLQSSGSCSGSSSVPANVAANDNRLRVVRSQYHENFDQENYFNQTEAVGIVNTFGIQHTILGGVEYGWQNKNTVFYRNGSASPVSFVNPILTRPTNNGIASTNNNFKGRVFGVYVQDQITFNRKWKALVGVRYDDFRQKLDDFLPVNVDLNRTDKQFSPRGGLVYQPNDWLSFYGSYSRSFQPSGENLTLAANNSQLKPEMTRNYEGGVKATFEPYRINATLSVFRLDRDNIKTNDPFNPNSGLLVLLGEQRTNGAEVTVSGSPLRKLDVVAGYSFLDARIVKSNTVSGGVSLQGKTPQLTPRNSGNLWVTYQLPMNLRLGFGGFARGKTFASTTNRATLPGYARFDASLAWRSEKHYEISFNLKNILNRKYIETAHNDSNLLPGSPINGSVTMRYRW